MADTPNRTEGGTAKPCVTSARRKAGAKPAAAGARRAAASQAGAEAGGTDLNKKALIEAVVARSGIKQKDAKPVIEAMLAVLGETIAEGRELNLPPLGKLKVNRSVEKPNARVIVCRLRQRKPGAGAGKDPLAPGGDEG